jgi:NhaA family Na+:H+ antiporter
MQEFIHRSASGGIVLMLAAVIALVLANSPLAEAYDHLLHTYIGISVGTFQLKLSLLHWINDALMAIFFFVVGLEIKRELRVGELANVRAALLPIVAATGGAILPALIYAALNFGSPGIIGWGIPMATDIAFAIGVLALLGKRVPFPLTVFVTAVAIVDDLIAVLVIALFYSGGINFLALGIGFAVIALLLLGNLFGIRAILFYLALGVVVWLAFLQSGVHATVAGVLVAWTVPSRNRIDAPTFLGLARGILDRFEKSQANPSRMLTDEVQQSAVLELEDACEHVQAPLQKLEHSLHTWVAFAIMPIFALANAGVGVSFGDLPEGSSMVMLGIMLGLVLGKPIGLVGISWLAVRAGVTMLPAGVQWSHMVGAGFLAGIGFTMSLFVATLGFGESPLLEAAKLGILGASIIAGVLGFVLLSRTKPVEG